MISSLPPRQRYGRFENVGRLADGDFDPFGPAISASVSCSACRLSPTQDRRCFCSVIYDADGVVITYPLFTGPKLQTQVIAEREERRVQARRAGTVCDEIQDCYLSKPQPAEAFPMLLQIECAPRFQGQSPTHPFFTRGDGVIFWPVPSIGKAVPVPAAV